MVCSLTLSTGLLEQLFLWRFNNSDPYGAVGYDLLHYFDSGIWGKHVWPCLKLYLQAEKFASKFNDQ
jgi:hypothetical protein